LKKYKYLIFPLGIFLIWLCAAVSNTIENNNMTSVTFVDVTQRHIHYTAAVEAKLESSHEIRVRTPSSLILEDVFVHEGDLVEAGTPIASVYDKALIEEISLTNDPDTLEFLMSIQKNSYFITAEEDGYITELLISEDSKIMADYIVYKYVEIFSENFNIKVEIDENISKKFTVGDKVKYTYNQSNEEKTYSYTGEAFIEYIADGEIICSIENNDQLRHGDSVTLNFRHISNMYESIIPMHVIYEQQDSQYSNRYKIYYAVPIHDKDNRYTVVEGLVEVLEDNGIYAAIEFNYKDGREIIDKYSGSLVQYCVVRKGM